MLPALPACLEDEALEQETTRLLAAVPRRAPSAAVAVARNAPSFPEVWEGLKGPELVLAIARYARVRLRWSEGHAVIQPAERSGMRLPSRAARRYLAQLTEQHSGRVPSDAALRRAMHVLLGRAEEAHAVR